MNREKKSKYEQIKEHWENQDKMFYKMADDFFFERWLEFGEWADKKLKDKENE